MLIGKRCKQDAKPVRSWDGIVVEIGNYVAITFGKSSISRATQALYRFNHVASREFAREAFCVTIAFRVVDQQHLIGSRIQLCDARKALTE